MEYVEFTSLRRSFELYKNEYEHALLGTARSGWYILGQELAEFESEFASYIGVKNCIGVNSGLDAIVLSVRALGIGRGDEVIVPSNTYIATVLGITENGAVPVFAEPDEYFGVDASGIEALITERTRAVMPVHLYGQTCSMGAITEVAGRYGIKIIEDCAQAHGASFEGLKAGAFGDAGCFSFYPTKPLGAFGDAGCVVTNDDSLAETIRMLRNYGSKKKYCHNICGVNSRMDELQAAVLRVGLKHLEDGNSRRRSIAHRYLKEIDNSLITLPKERKGAEHVYHIFAVLCEERDALQRHLLDSGIRTQIHYPIPPHLSECYSFFGYVRGDFPTAERLADELLSLPIYSAMPEQDVDRVIRAVNDFDGRPQ